MSQYTYGITRICYEDFPCISARQLADVREPSVESSQTIRGNIAGYVPAECSTEGLPQNVRRILHINLCKVYAISRGRFVDSIVCKLPKIVLRTPRRWIRGHLKDNSADSQKTISWTPETWSANFRTGFTENRDRLPRKSLDFRK